MGILLFAPSSARGLPAAWAVADDHRGALRTAAFRLVAGRAQGNGRRSVGRRRVRVIGAPWPSGWAIGQ
ncbi:MAG TPA: hypothetical protein VFC03_08335 [Acidimicrobiales bacterium]|nr:hypothetical protein [Acidimicrobiales bacterium]